MGKLQISGKKTFSEFCAAKASPRGTCREYQVKPMSTRIRHLWQDRSLATRFLFVYLLLSLLTVATLTWRSGTQLSTALEEEYEHELELQAFVVASALTSDMEDMLKGKRSPVEVLALVRRFATDTDSRITVLNTNQEVVFSTDPAVPPGAPQNFPEITAALVNQEQHHVRVDEYTGDERLYVAAPIREEDHLLGVVQISIPWERVQGRIYGEWTRLLITGSLAVLANILVSLWLAFSITRPLYELTAAAHDIAAGHLSRRIPITSRDEVGRLAQAFNEMAHQLQEMINRQHMFIANASHELRGPLTSIKLRTEAVLDNKDMPPEQRERFLAEVDQEVDRLRRTAERLLDLSRLHIKADARPFQVVSLGPILRDTLDVLLPRARQHNLTLQEDIPQSLPPVYADPDDLAELFLNLLDNAIKYTPPGGTVTVRARVDNQHVVVEVADTGEGIPPEDLPHIFEPFYRVDKARTRRVGGSGLGLAIVKAIVERHGGKIDVRSTVGEGTTFYVTLPLYSAQRESKTYSVNQVDRNRSSSNVRTTDDRR